MRWWLLVALVVAPRAAEAQRAPARFEITAVTDSTLAFRAADARWLRPGVVGTAVDPRRRDQMVARFRVLTVADGVATALITGQTTDVSTDHVATVDEPEPRWYRRGTFWLGLLLGGVLGGVVGASA